MSKSLRLLSCIHLFCVAVFILCTRVMWSISIDVQHERRRTRYSRHHRHLSDQWIQKNLIEKTTHQAPCPCNDVSLCKTIHGPPIRPKSEVFGFLNNINHTGFFNWTYVSTVAWASEDSIMCEAHAHQSRAVLAAPTINLGQLQDAQARRDWVQNALTMVQSRYRDGLVFDYEEPIPAGSPLATIYTRLVQETTATFHAANPSLQITVCVAWSPDGIDRRNYPYKQLADASDALYVMDYDTQSQIFNGACLASANAPFFGMVYGLQRYLDLGIDPSKLILGVPWYGYRYPCENETSLQSRYCPIKQVPFRGINCSDAAGSEISVLSIHRIGRQDNASVTGRDEYMDASFMNTKEEDTLIQYWFDDVTSLQNKFTYAAKVGLGGIGPYSFDDLNYAVLDPQGFQYAANIWRTFEAFFRQERENSVDEKETAYDSKYGRSTQSL